MIVLFYTITFDFVTFYYYVFETCSFLTRDTREVHPDGKVGGKELGGIEGGESIIKAYFKKRIFSIKIQKNVKPYLVAEII